MRRHRPRGRAALTEAALRGLFDHAGMFPPAQKPLADALRDAARFRRTLQRPGLVGADLVVTAQEWPNVTPQALAAAGFQGTCRLAIVGVPLEEGEAAARRATAAPPDRPVASLEVHIDGPIDEATLRRIVAVAGRVPVFVEPKWPSETVRTDVALLAEALQRAGAGLKVRCAGPTALDRPALAAAVRTAADAGIPFKATQGLHHPVPRPDFPHGFLGLLAAVRLRQARGATFDDIEACLAEPEVGAFRLRDGIAWRQHHISAARLATLPPFAIGSCSLSEPDDDLMQACGPPPA